MKVLLTGASSFTGYWFAKTLADAGHEVTAPLLRERKAYETGIRADRVKKLEGIVRLVPDCVFGATTFMGLLKEEFDLLAHHAAQVADYRSPEFDISAAVASNTNNLRAVLSSGKIGAMLLTSSVFAQGEGAGTSPLPAFSAYGLSKGLTTEIVSFQAAEANVPLGRFVIPNPFGPLEEPRFCAYLIRTWKTGTVAGVNTPGYVRDNIHVDLLAKAYIRYAEGLVSGTASAVLNPSGYVSTQGDFARRFAAEMRPRLGIECMLEFAHQTDFSEPLMRVNTDPATVLVQDWDEETAWDRVAEAYA